MRRDQVTERGDRKMRYAEFRDAIRAALRRNRTGLTWPQLRDRLGLPYDRPCPEWTKRLEREIGLRRVKGPDRALCWRVNAAPASKGAHDRFDGTVIR
jgi:hypothetical protein